jgi:hypothetical protein
MASFVARSCMPNPRIDVLATAPDTGATLRSTTYRGLLDVSVDTNKGPTMTEGTLDVTLPDGLSYPASQVSAGTVACTVAPVGIDPITADVRIAVGAVAARFVDDPQHAGTAIVQLSIGLRATNLLETYTTRLAYEVTAVVPHG